MLATGEHPISSLYVDIDDDVEFRTKRLSDCDRNRIDDLSAKRARMRCRDSILGKGGAAAISGRGWDWWCLRGAAAVRTCRPRWG